MINSTYSKEYSNPSTWTINQVEEWLKKNNLNDYISILCHENQIDGKRLMDLNENDILILTKNNQLWLKIKKLKPQSTTIQIEPVAVNSSTPYDLIEDQPIANCCFFTSMRSDRKKTLSAFLLVLCTIYFCSFIITIVDERLPDPKNFPPLPDLILENIEQIPWAFAVTEKLILVEMTTLFTIILLHRHKYLKDFQFSIKYLLFFFLE